MGGARSSFEQAEKVSVAAITDQNTFDHFIRLLGGVEVMIFNFKTP
jgi:hypothetical protein